MARCAMCGAACASSGACRATSGELSTSLCARQRADAQHAALHRDAAPGVEAGDVDQQRRLRQPHVQRGQQRLPAGEHARVVAVLRQQLEGVLRRIGADVVEGRGFHGLRFRGLDESPARVCRDWGLLTKRSTISAELTR